jgi:hypothetical protein
MNDRHEPAVLAVLLTAGTITAIVIIANFLTGAAR